MGTWYRTAKRIDKWEHKKETHQNLMLPLCPRRAFCNLFPNIMRLIAAVAQWVRALAPQAKGWVFESQSRQALVVKTISDRSTAKHSLIECNGSSEMTIINGCLVSQWVWHATEPPLINGLECRVLVKIWNPSLLMVTSTNEWKILEWENKPQPNKTNEIVGDFIDYESSALSKPISVGNYLFVEAFLTEIVKL